MKKFPISLYFIILVEFCSRFAFCGVRTLLSLYLRNVVLLGENASTVVYHVFIMTCFTVPFVGAILADGWLGRFSTILLFSFVACIGHVTFFAATTHLLRFDILTMTMVGLTLLAIGAGGVKPCMAAFGGDQFLLPEEHSRLLSFFSLFYFTANLGGLVGTLTTPVIRQSFSCFGEDTCYSYGFGLPALLALLTVVIFALGKPFYRIQSPKENVMGLFLCCVTRALLARMRGKKAEKDDLHWLDYAGDKYSASLIEDIKAVFAILLLFVPLPIFWSLIVQQGSRWTFQATRMDGHVWGVEILPDHIQALGPAIVLFLIPIFDRVVYPFLSKCNVLSSPLNRMAVGGIAAGLAFVCAGVVEGKLQGSYPPAPPSDQAHVLMINTLPCDLLIQPGEAMTPEPGWSLLNRETLTITGISVDNATQIDLELSCVTSCAGLRSDCQADLRVLVTPGQTKTVIVAEFNNSLESYSLAAEDLTKPLSGRPKLRLIFIRGEDVDGSGVSLYDSNGLTHFYYVGTEAFGLSNYTELHTGRYSYYVTYSKKTDEEFQGFMDLKPGGVYALVLQEVDHKIVFAENFALVPGNEVHMVWLVPQYVLISVAEVLFAISGMEFCFSQAPKSMKTVTMAAWYFTVACGNMLVIVITQLHAFSTQAEEFFLFSGLLVADLLLFKWMCAKYHARRVPDTARTATTVYGDYQNYPVIGMPSHLSIHS